MNKYPILLAHGIARFDILQHALIRFVPGLRFLFGDRLHYFKGIRSHLRANGYDVRHANVDFAGSVEKRAAELAQQVNAALRLPVGPAVPSGPPSGDSKVHIVAHSMGGLDARYMIVNIAGMAERVATLTTIGTPHHGTVFADHGLSAGGERLIAALRPLIDLTGFEDLTTPACQKFNGQAMATEAANAVLYQTYSSSQQCGAVFKPLQPSWRIIEKAEGSNDGLVSVKSQAWVSELTAPKASKRVVQNQFPFPADHLNEVGWWDPNEPRTERKRFEANVKNVYLNIAKDLLEHEE